MVLFCIIGELGAGKTLTLTYLSWLNWFRKRQKIYANYNLYKIPYIYIRGINQLNTMHNGFVAVDEMWTLIDSRTTTSKRNKIVADILLRSRKRDLTYVFTSQLLDLLDKRIRKLLDFTAYCVLNRTETIGKVFVFRGGYPKEHSLMKTFMFRTPLFFKCYDTNQEIDMLEEDENEPKIIFQESKEKPPKFFDTWEDADKYAEKYWENNKNELMPMLYGSE